MTDCRFARDTLGRQALGVGKITDGDLTQAHTHIVACAACQDYLRRFSRAILSRDPGEIPCAEVRLQLDRYRTSGGVGAAMERVRDHLARCQACAAEAASWESITALAGQGALAEPARYPTFDLSFLPQQSIWEQVRAGARRLSYEVPAALALAGKTLLTPQPGMAVSYAGAQAATRGAPSSAKGNVVSLAVDDTEQDVRISLDVNEADTARWLAISLRLLSTGQALEGTRVALCNEQGQAQEIRTVRPGESEARFPDIAPGQYLVRIEHSGQMWELPLSL